jgi:hypothetical protein
MKNSLELLAQVFNLVSGLLLTTAILTPATVKQLGNKIASWLKTPAGWIMAKAGQAAVYTDPDKQFTIVEGIARGAVQVAVQLYTLMASTVFCWTILIAISIYGFVMRPSVVIPTGFTRYIPPNVTLSSDVIYWASVCGLIIAVSYLFWLVAFFLSDLGRSSNAATWILFRLGFCSWPLRKVITATFWFLSIFTIFLPRWWYRGIKVVHEKGVEWLLAVIGIQLFVVGTVLQMITIYMD